MFAEEANLFAIMDHFQDLIFFKYSSLRQAANWFEVNGFKLNTETSQIIAIKLMHIPDGFETCIWY